MNKIFSSVLIVLGIVSAALIVSMLVRTPGKSSFHKKETVPFYVNEEKPKETLSIEEQETNQRHLERYISSKTSLKSTSNLSSYANGNVQGTWDQVQFLAPEKQSYGFRVDGSVYDQFNDVLYAISYAGHIWKIKRQSEDYTKTEWERINHKSNFKTSYIEGLNKAGGAFRMVRSSDNGMQFSDDEGRNWNSASGVQFTEATNEGAVAKTTIGNRIFVAGKINSTTIQTYISTNNGESYSALSPKFNSNNYTVKIFKPCFSESIFLLAFNNSNSKISIYECLAEDSDFKLIYSPSTVFTGLTRVFGTYYNEKFHFYIAGAKTHIYYSDDKGANWKTKNSNNSGDGDIYPRTVHPTKPNIIFRGYLDVNLSINYGTTFENFSHRLGWDVHHMKMYQKKDGTYFHFIGKDFGCYISDKPETASEYVQLNNSAPTQMIYDADHSQNYYSSFTSTQDRGTMGYVSSSNQSATNDVRTTDGLRVTLGNNEESVWTWMYFGTLYHSSNFAARKTSLTSINWTGKWWAAPMIPSPNVKEDAVYIAAGNSLKKFTYNSEQEAIIETDHYFDFLQETGSPVTGFGYSKLNRNKWYVSVKNGDFLYSLDGGQTFEKSSYSGLFPRANDQYYNHQKNQHVIKASNISENRVFYAGVGNLFMISDDGGKNFTNHSNGLDVYRIRDFDLSEDEKFIYAACGSAGIWVYSVDSDQWFEMNDEAVPNVDFTDVEYIVKENTVNFASFGNGVLRFKIDDQKQALQYPDSLKAEITNTNLVNLRWNDKSENEDGFVLERAVNGVFSPIKSLAANQVSFTDSNVVKPGIYYYRIKAFNSTHESYFSNYTVAEVKPTGEVSKKGWQLISVDSEETNYEARKVFDEDKSTMWHTQWTINPIPFHPHTFVIDMNDTLGLYGFRYLPRQDNSWNGVTKDYAFYVSMDNQNWIKVAEGSWQKTRIEKEVEFTTPIEARYIKLVSLSEVNGTAFASCAELSVITQLSVLTTPNSPQFVQGGRLSDSEIELIWLDLSDNELGFVVEQLIDGSFSAIYSSGVNATTYKLQNTNINTSYTFRIKAFNIVGSSAYSDTLTIYVPNTVVSAKDKIRSKNSVVVYPNPFEDELKIQFGGSGLFSDWQILNMSGELIINGTISEYSNSVSIKVPNLKSGSYVIRFKRKSGWISKMLVKK